MTSKGVKIYTVLLTTRQGNKKRLRINALNESGALRKLYMDYRSELDGISNIYFYEPIMYSQKKRQEYLNRSKGAKRAHQKKLQEDIMRYDGLTPIPEENDE